ncbi:Spore germination protein B3 precursor [Turicibacter sanguinis]|nr:Spore germination protein B3 precursor [Turicibacter sanguinis]
MKRWLFLMSVLVCLSGCAHKVEMSQLGIVSGFGIDKIEDRYRLTAQVVNPSSIAGNQHDTLSIFSVSAEGETLYDAYRELNTLTSKVLYLPHLSVIVLDEEIAKDGINTVLDFVLRNAAIRPNITVAIANNAPAADILHVLIPSDQIPITQLDSLSNMCVKCTGRQVNYNLYQVSERVNAEGDNIVLNSVAIIGDGISQGEKIENILQVEPPTQLQIDSLAAFKSDKLVGYLDSEEAEYYNLLVGNSKRYVLNTVIDETYKVAYEARDTKVEIKPNLDEKKVKVECKVSGILMENEYPINLMEPKNISILQSYFEETLKKDLMDFISKTQQELQSDILGVGSKIHQKDPKKWAAVNGYWEEIYPTLEFEVDVKIEINSVGDIANLKD